MQNRAYAFLLLTTLFWGGNAVAGKLAVGHVSPMVLVALRWLMATVILAILGGRQLAEDWPKVRRNLWLLGALGACGFTFFNALFYTALTYTTAINVAIEQAGMPVLIILINFLLFRLRISWLQVLGVIATMAGVALMACHGDPAQLLALGVNIGDGLMLIAVLLYSGYTVFLRFKPDIHWKSLMLVLPFFALLASLPFAAWEISAGKEILPDVTGWAIALYVVLFPSTTAQILFIRGNEMIGANRAGLFINLVPIFGTLLSVLIVGESFTKTLSAFDIAADDRLSNRRVWATLTGGPDGITLDAEDCVWSSAFEKAVRVKAGGEVLEEIPLDRFCFATMLGGDDGRTLFMVCNEWTGSTVNLQKTGRIYWTRVESPRAGWPG